MALDPRSQVSPDSPLQRRWISGPEAGIGLKRSRSRLALTSFLWWWDRRPILLSIRDYLASIALFCNGVKGVAALRLSRDMNINPKSAFVLAAMEDCAAR
jgi:hypothetical protein